MRYVGLNTDGSVNAGLGNFMAPQPGIAEVPIDETSAEFLQAFPANTPQDLHNAAIDAQIDAMERATMYPRGVREALMAYARDKAAEYAESHPGVTADQVLAVNPGYQRMKQFDDQVAALRAQRI